MIREHGPFEAAPPPAVGWVDQNGIYWNLYVLGRVDYGPQGELLALYEDDTKEEPIEIGTRFFAEVRNGSVQWVSPNPSMLNPLGGTLIVETSDPVEVGMLYADGVFDAPPPVPASPIEIPADVLYFERMTDAEFTALDDSILDVEGRRVHRAFSVTRVFVENTDMWTMLVKHLDAIGTTPERRAELLARPS